MPKFAINLFIAFMRYDMRPSSITGHSEQGATILYGDNRKVIGWRAKQERPKGQEGVRMRKGTLGFRYEHRELVKDLTNVIISYTPVSGILDTARFLDKWLLRRRKAHRFFNGMARRYRMFRLEMAARRHNSP